jgi:tRNA nucleotidyltransferase (CCA-adding enzyme)
MAEDASGGIIDPYGGRRDLEARLLRHVSPAFVEDPLRVLRVARFAARFAPLGFTVAPETLELMRAIVASGEMSALVPERVWAETERALGEASPVTYFEVLRACGALAAVFPEVHALFGVPQPEKWHPEIDTGVHTLQVLEVAAELSPDTTVRFAALVHDLGKGLTPRAEWPRHLGHEEAGARLIERMAERLRVPNEHRELAVMVARHHARAHHVAEQRPGTILELLELTDAFRRRERFERFLLACEADARGRGPGLRTRPYPQAAQLRAALAAAASARLPQEILERETGPVIAERLRAARIAAIRSLNQA